MNITFGSKIINPLRILDVQKQILWRIFWKNKQKKREVNVHMCAHIKPRIKGGQGFRPICISRFSWRLQPPKGSFVRNSGWKDQKLYACCLENSFQHAQTLHVRIYEVCMFQGPRRPPLSSGSWNHREALYVGDMANFWVSDFGWHGCHVSSDVALRH